jgi:hypothetical protein
MVKARFFLPSFSTVPSSISHFNNFLNSIIAYFLKTNKLFIKVNLLICLLILQTLKLFSFKLVINLYKSATSRIPNKSLNQFIPILYIRVL